MERMIGLIDDHGRLVDISETLLDEVRSDTPDPARSADILASLQDLLQHHMQVEGQVIAALKEEDSRFADPLLHQRRDYFHSLVSDWDSYIVSWSANAIRRDWDRFAGETIPIVERLITQVMAENSACVAISRQMSRSGRKLRKLGPIDPQAH